MTTYRSHRRHADAHSQRAAGAPSRKWTCRHRKLKTDIAKILKDEGYIANFKLTEEGAKKSIRIYLKYTPGNVPVISRIERVSRPGCRVYVGARKCRECWAVWESTF